VSTCDREDSIAGVKRRLLNLPSPASMPAGVAVFGCR
jgi:hypothetical protein